MSNDDDFDIPQNLFDPFNVSIIVDNLITLFDGKTKAERLEQLPPSITSKLIIHTKVPAKHVFELAIEVSKRGLSNYLSRTIVKSFSPLISFLFNIENNENNIHYTPDGQKFDHYENIESFSKGQSEALIDLYKYYFIHIKNPMFAIILSNYAIFMQIDFNCDTKGVCAFSGCDTIIFLNRLKNSKSLFEYSTLVAHNNLYSLIDFDSVLIELVIKNDLQNLQIICGKLYKSYLFDLIERNIYTELQSSNPGNSQLFARSGKVVKKLIDKFIVNGIIQNYPAIWVSIECSIVAFIIRLTKKTLSADGNPALRAEDICESFIDRLVDITFSLPLKVQIQEHNFFPRQALINFAKTRFERASLTAYGQKYGTKTMVNQILVPCRLYQIDDLVSELYYTHNAPIILVDTICQANLFENKMESMRRVSLDCEWTSSDLSITQIACDFKDYSRTIYIFDMLAFSSQRLKAIMAKLFSTTTVIGINHLPGFDVGQDIRKILAHSGLTEYPTHLIDIQDTKTAGCNSLSHYTFRYLGKHLDKRVRMSWWERRPLYDFQLLYAGNISSIGSDAEVLLDLYDKIND